MREREVKLRQRVLFWLAGLLGSLVTRALISTLRVRVLGEQFLPPLGGKGIIYCFWHSNLLSLAYLYRNRNIHVLVSGHRDGEYIVRITKHLGYGAIRGSSTRGGARSVAEALDKLERGVSVGVTPDGPRGPRQQFKPGALFLAKESGAPIIMGACIPERAWRLKSWDGFIVPKPFSRTVLALTDYIRVPREMTDEEMERKRLELEETLNGLWTRAEEELARWRDVRKR